MQLQLDSRANAVSAYIARCSDKGLPPAFQSELCRFGTVLICGNVERSLEIIVLDRLTKKAHPKVLAFIKSHFKRGTNYDCAAISQLLVRFDSEWYRQFELFVAANGDVKEGISSCYALRNATAHGGTGNVSLNRLTELFDLSKRLIAGVVAATAS
jgi:hypothetical protein